MRHPLFLQASDRLSGDTACVIQALHMLGKIEPSDFASIAQQVGLSITTDERQVVLGILLQYGVHIRTISPLDPRTILGPQGKAHLANVWHELGVGGNLDALCDERLPGLRVSMRNRLQQIAKFPNQYVHECRTGNDNDIRQALAAGHIVATQNRNTGTLMLILPGATAKECWIYNPAEGTTQPYLVDWAMINAESPVVAVYSSGPF